MQDLATHLIHLAHRSPLQMNPPKVSQEAVFAGANLQSHISDYSQGIVAFGASQCVALWAPTAPSHKGVYSTLNHHSKEVTCVRFVPTTPWLISAGADGTICLYEREGGKIGSGATTEITEINESQLFPSFCLVHSQQTGSASITTLAICDETMFITGSSNGDLCIWKISGNSFSIAHTFTVKKSFFPTTLAVQKVGSAYVVAIAGTSCDIYIYSFSNSTDLVLCAVLPGHEDWIKALSFVCERNEPGSAEYLLASGSQDRYIRLWRLRIGLAVEMEEDDQKLVLLTNKQFRFTLPTSDQTASHSPASFSFEALLMGHDDWVTGLKWHPSNESGSSRSKLTLLSLSADTALMIWEMDEDSGIWVSTRRLGELSIKGASTATGSSGGFWSCLWFNDPISNNQYILASGKTGAIRMYRSGIDSDSDLSDSESSDSAWESVLGISGPAKEVTDLVWAPDGKYFFATSLDQTTRLFAPWKKHRDVQVRQSEALINFTNVLDHTWHEFARPQIHGYDMICMSSLGPTRIVSGGDEKIFRVLEVTQSINRLLHRFCDVNSESSNLPEAASLPVLGLSNKAANDQLEAGEAQQREEDFENGETFTNDKMDPLAILTGPPLEDHLQRHTLFPELEKLYGHGYEVTCCATSPHHGLIASACRSNSAKHAVIRIFNADRDFQLVSESLQGHNLTITSMEFSPDGQFLVAVSRDRQFSLWRVSDVSEGRFELVHLDQKAHTRIIWDCSWTPSEFGGFVTGSRDKSIKLWKIVGTSATAVSTIKVLDAVTSISCFQNSPVLNRLLICAGSEDGSIGIYASDLAEPVLERVLEFPKEISPASRVNKLSFGPGLIDGELNLAVGSTDTSVRVYSVKF